MNRLHQLRTERCIKQEDLAKILSIDVCALSRYERGSAKMANINLENKICNFFDCSLDYLRGRSNIRNQAQYSETLKKISDMILSFYSNETKNKQDISDDELVQFEELILQYKDSLKKLSTLRSYL